MDVRHFRVRGFLEFSVRSFVMTHLRTILLAAALFVPLVATPARALELSVMSFNIRYGSANDGENAWENRKDIVANTIREYTPDVLGLQECLLFQAEYLESVLPEYARFGVGRERNGGGERMEIFYKKELLAPLMTGHYWLSETPAEPGSRSWNSANVRMVSWAEFYHYPSRERFYFFNTHFDHRSEEARQGAASMLAIDIPQRAKDLPAILTGDFNTPADTGVAWNTMTEAGLKDAWRAAKERKGPEVTWSAFRAPEPGARRRIDWIMLYGDIECTSTETIVYNEQGQYPSDHYPVFSRIILDKNRTN
jgi:endonuclease/exonuclease/phosphatase family metal-dependent hydrolase